jgi:hypothetical protein
MRNNFIKLCLLKLLSNAHADMNDLRLPTGGLVTTNRVDCTILKKSVTMSSDKLPNEKTSPLNIKGQSHFFQSIVYYIYILKDTYIISSWSSGFLSYLGSRIKKITRNILK